MSTTPTIEIVIQEKMTNPTQARILAWERAAYRACELCRWGVTQHAQVPDDQPMGESVRICINPAVVGTRPGASTPVNMARYRMSPHQIERPKFDGVASLALGACGPEAKYLDFPGLNK